MWFPFELVSEVGVRVVPSEVGPVPREHEGEGNTSWAITCTPLIVMFLTTSSLRNVARDSLQLFENKYHYL